MTYAHISATFPSRRFSVNQLTESLPAVNETYEHIRIDCSFDSRAGDRQADGQLGGTGAVLAFHLRRVTAEHESSPDYSIIERLIQSEIYVHRTYP